MSVYDKPLWKVYIARCADNTLYCGISSNVDKRINLHNSGKGAKYIRGSRIPAVLVIMSVAMSCGDALTLERLIKTLPRSKKVAFIKKTR